MKTIVAIFPACRAHSFHYSSGGPGIAQSHQPGPQRPQSVQTHTPQITVPAQVVAQHVRGGVANAAAGSFLSGLRTCTLNCTFPRLSLVKSLSTSRVSTASIVSFP